jgi:hypothetical protein
MKNAYMRNSERASFLVSTLLRTYVSRAAHLFNVLWPRLETLARGIHLGDALELRPADVFTLPVEHGKSRGCSVAGSDS